MPRRKAAPSGTRFDVEEADRVQRIFERVFCHTKGIYAGAPFVLTDWQRDEIIRPLYGEQRFDEQTGLWVRKHSTAWVEIGRGNGKSEIAAGVALEGLVFDGEEGAEVYGAAEDRDQATIVFRVAKRMCELSPILAKMVDRKQLVIVESRKRIIYTPTDSFYQVLPRDELGEGSQGFAPHVIVFDEVHVQRGRELIDALRRGMGKRVQSLMFMITTAGNNLAGPAKEEHDFAESVVEGRVEAPHYFVFMRNTPMDADPFDESNWHYANPGLGDFLSIETLRQEAAEAKAKPSEENAFRQYRLNQWVSNASRWISSATYDRGASITPDESALAGCEAYGGLDLAAVADFCALVWTFPTDDDRVIWLPRFWLPEAVLETRRTKMRRSIELWARQGFLTITEGEVVDDDAVFEQLCRDAKLFDVRSIAYDPWEARSLARKALDANLPMIEHPQTIARMNEPTKATETLLVEDRVVHGGNPILRWMFANVVLKYDNENRIKPDRRKSTEKIDGAVAAIMSTGFALNPPDTGEKKKPVVHSWYAEEAT